MYSEFIYELVLSIFRESILSLIYGVQINVLGTEMAFHTHVYY